MKFLLGFPRLLSATQVVSPCDTTLLFQIRANYLILRKIQPPVPTSKGFKIALLEVRIDRVAMVWEPMGAGYVVYFVP